MRDFVIGATHSYTEKGYVRVYSGANQMEIGTIWGEVLYARFGATLAQVGDLDGDGVRDLVVGAPYANGGRVRAYSAASLVHLWDADGAQLGDEFGSAITELGDLDGDGVPEVLVGAPGADQPGSDAGALSVLSGADGSVLRLIADAVAGDALGSSLATPGDVDADGVLDVAAGLPGADRGRQVDSGALQLRSGADLALLYECAGQAAGDALGCATAAAGDVNGDGVPDFVAGASGADGGGWSGSGSACLHSGSLLPLHADALVVSVGSGGRVDFTLDAGASHAGRRYLLIASASGGHPGFDKGAIHVPLNLDAFLLFSIEFAGSAVFPGSFGVLDGNGRATAGFDTLGPLDPIWAGHQVHFAWVLLSPVGAASNALPVELIP